MKVERNDPCPCGSGRKFKNCHRCKVVAHTSEKFVVSVKVMGNTYKLFQIIFHTTKAKDKTDLIVSFPYKKKPGGLVSIGTLPKNIIRADKISLKTNGKVTSHNIKYSHWVDGSVHFSQDDKIFTFRKNPSNPLMTSCGHIFTVQFKGFRGFTKKTDTKKLTSKEIDLDVDIGGFSKESLKCVAYWYDESVIRVKDGHYGALMTFQHNDGVVDWAFVLKPPADSPLNSKILILSFRRVAFMTKAKGSHLLFLGGFDPLEIWRDLNNDFSFLAYSCPAVKPLELEKQIGTIDRDRIINPKLIDVQN